MMTFTFGTVAFVNAYVSLPYLWPCCFSSHLPALNPYTLVRVQYRNIESIAECNKVSCLLCSFRRERAVKLFYDFCPSSLYTSLERFATAPTVSAFRRMKPVTISFAYAAFTSKKIWLSDICVKAIAVSQLHSRFLRRHGSSHPRIHHKTHSSSLLHGSMQTRERILSRISSSMIPYHLQGQTSRSGILQKTCPA